MRRRDLLVRRRLLALSLGLCIGAAIAARPADAVQCAPRAKIVAALSKRHGERPISIAMTNDGRVLELWANADGPWTLLITTPHGVSCIQASGAMAWENLPQGDPV